MPAWLARAMLVRRALRLPKYSAEPKPVRIAEGSVPRHSCLIGEGPEVRERSVAARVVPWACWMRVFKRSAGWRRMEVNVPLQRPAKKWTEEIVLVLGAGI